MERKLYTVSELIEILKNGPLVEKDILLDRLRFWSPPSRIPFRTVSPKIRLVKKKQVITSFDQTYTKLVDIHKKIIVYLHYDAARLIKISTLNMIDGSAELLYLNNYNVQDKNKWDLILHQKN